MTASSCDRELNAHFYSAALLTYHYHAKTLDMSPHPVRSTSPSSTPYFGVTSTIFNDFGIEPWIFNDFGIWPWIEPVTSRSPKRTLYHLSCRGRYTLNVYCCVDIIISLNGYCKSTDAAINNMYFCCLLSIDKMKENEQHNKIL